MRFQIGVFRPNRPGVRKVLGDLEAEIMELVWARPPGGITVREVFEALYPRRRLAYTTVMTTMTRLAKKGLLKAHKRSTAYVYSPMFTRDQFVSRVVDRILEDLLVSFGGPTVHRLNVLDPNAAARARNLLRIIAQRRRHEER
jgi:predicted transcriptional regulator